MHMYTLYRGLFSVLNLVGLDWRFFLLGEGYLPAVFLCTIYIQLLCRLLLLLCFLPIFSYLFLLIGWMDGWTISCILCLALSDLLACYCLSHGFSSFFVFCIFIRWDGHYFYRPMFAWSIWIWVWDLGRDLGVGFYTCS
jgi:hypothetical protein